MINKLILIVNVCIWFAYQSLTAQVGINTQTPTGIFHVHIGNTASTSDDVVISSTGNMGIHTISPQAKLDLNGTLRVTGIPNVPSGEKYLIAAESDGTFTISKPGMIPSVQGDIPSNLTSLPSLPVSGASVDYKTIKITLPKGKWIVYFNATHSIDGTVTTLAAAESAVIKWEMINEVTGLSDNINPDYSAAGFVNSFSSTICIFVVDNHTGNTNHKEKTYYFRGSAVTQNPMSFVYTADLWAEYYTTP